MLVFFGPGKSLIKLMLILVLDWLVASCFGGAGVFYPLSEPSGQGNHNRSDSEETNIGESEKVNTRIDSQGFYFFSIRLVFLELASIRKFTRIATI